MRKFVMIQTTQGDKILLNINYIVQVSPIDDKSVLMIVIAGDRVESFTAVGDFDTWEKFL